MVEKIQKLIKQLTPDISTGRDLALGTESIDAAYILGQIGESAIPSLVNALKNSSDAYLAIAYIGGEQSFQILFAQLKSGLSKNDSVIIKAAGRGLGYLGDIRALELLQSSLNKVKDYEAHYECAQAIRRIQIKNAKPDDPIPMLAKAEQLWQTKEIDEALSTCEQLAPIVGKLDKDRKGWYWFLRGMIIRDKFGQKDPRFREYCLRSLLEDYRRSEAWRKIEGDNPFSQKTYFEAMVDTMGIDDLKAELFDNVKFPTKPIDWNHKITDSFHINKPIYFIDEQEIINDLETIAKLDELNINIQWNLVLCLAYGSDRLANTVAHSIVKVVEKYNNTNPLNWMVKTMLSTAEVPSGITWNAGAKGLKILLQNCSSNVKVKLYEIVDKETGFDISYTYDIDNDDSRKVIFAREIKKQGQNNTISTSRIYKAESRKESFDFLWRVKIDDSLLHLIIETPEGIFCRDIYGIYKERQ